MGIAASARASLGIYNSKQDIDALSDAIENATRFLVIKWILKNYIKK